MTSEIATTELTIERLGTRAEGLVRIGNETLAVPYALPGEKVRAYRDGKGFRLLDVLQPSPARARPPCPLFTRCGGCAAQHLDTDTYRIWKTGLVDAALRRAGVALPIEKFVDAHGSGRRRMTLHLRDVDGHLESGFMAAGSHDLVPITACPVTVPALAEAPDVARRVGSVLNWRSKPLDVQVTATEAGLDVDIRGHGPASERQRLALTQAADAVNLARLSVHGDVVVARRPAVVLAGEVPVVIPAGGFLQATALGEETLATHVVAAARDARRVADLFAGAGAFALRLARRADVHAVESAAAALEVLDRAARQASAAGVSLRRVTTEARDLFRRPLLRPELGGFDAIVLDPPRAGAEAQCRQVASSTVPTVVMVSCDPTTFARDAAILIAGGYEGEPVTIVDQFRYSHHVELVATFRRPKQKGRR